MQSAALAQASAGGTGVGVGAGVGAGAGVAIGVAAAGRRDGASSAGRLPAQPTSAPTSDPITTIDIGRTAIAVRAKGRMFTNVSSARRRLGGRG